VEEIRWQICSLDLHVTKTALPGQGAKQKKDEVRATERKKPAVVEGKQQEGCWEFSGLSCGQKYRATSPVTPSGVLEKGTFPTAEAGDREPSQPSGVLRCAARLLADYEEAERRAMHDSQK